MREVTRQLSRRPGRKAAGPSLRRLTPGIRASIILVLLFTRPAKGAEAWKAPISTHVSGAQVAIADFDGDLNLDSASIQTDFSDGSRAGYCIRLRLTASGRQSILIVGPVGGLEIAARDVNGDHAVDLVLTGAWLRQPVAILLNDGHGNFSRVDPSAYPEAFQEPSAGWCSPLFPASVAAGVPSQTRAEVCQSAEPAPRQRPQLCPVRPPDSGALTRRFLISRLCRAPPQTV